MWPFDKFFKNNPTTENSESQQSTWSLSSIKKLFKREAKQSTSFFSSPFKWFQNRKVNTALKTLRDIIENNQGFATGKEKEIKSAMLTLRKYPDILKEKGMGYLEPFVNSDFKSGSLAISIAKEISQNTAEELIRTENFTPLGIESLSVPNTTANSINIMYKGDTGAEQRCFDGTKAFFINKGMNEESATKISKNIQQNYPLLLGITSLNNIEQKNAASTIVSQREGFDLKKYRDEVNFVKTTQTTLNDIAKANDKENLSPLMNKLSELNQQAHKIREYYAQIPQDPKNPNSTKILEGEEKVRETASNKDVTVRRPSISDSPERPTPNLRRNSKQSLGR
ncbi:MAG: hypothetical protein N4A31_02090 [Rickettsiales bacterium]|jgi:hypothetical protein|nr:hypothetical protein [Rickettsiales bacterium]